MNVCDNFVGKSELLVSDAGADPGGLLRWGVMAGVWGQSP